MRRVKYLAMLTGAVLICLAGGPAVAQDKPVETMDVVREKLRADKKLVVATALALTDTEAGRFWPLYNAYQSDMVAHYDRVLALVDTYAKTYQAMTEESAVRLLAEFLALEANHLAVISSYAPRFQQVLPAVKVAQLYQIENKVRALVNYELAQAIPLIK
jgi:hypothetical protein